MNIFNFLIRPANINDAEAIATIGYKSWQDSYQDILPKDFLSKLDLQDQIQRVKNKINRGAKILIAYNENYDAVGYCAFGNSKKTYSFKVATEIYSIYVAKDARSKGLGGFLLFEVERQFIMLKPIIVRILTDNVRARRFFEDNGYRYLRGEDGTFQNLTSDVAYIKNK